MSAGATIFEQPTPARPIDRASTSEAPAPKRRVLIASLNRRVGDTGVHTHTSVLQAGLADSGIDCAVVGPFDAGLPWLPVFAARRVIRPISRTASLMWYRRWHRAALRRAMLRRLAGATADVVLAQCPVSAAAALDVRKELGANFRVAMVCHFNHSEATEYRDRGELNDPDAVSDMLDFERRVLTEVDQVIYVSNWAREVVEHERDIQPRSSEVIWNGIPDDAALARDGGGPHPSPLPAYREREQRAEALANGHATIRRASDEIILMNVGSLEPRKNQVGLLDLFAKVISHCGSARLVLVGDGPDRARVEQRIDALGLAGRVRLLGHRSDVPDLLRAADVYVHYAAMENCPMALIEAARAGLPIAAVASGGVPELLAAFEGIAFDPLDHETSFERLNPLLLAMDVRRARGERAREGFLRHFTRDAMARAYLAALDLAPAGSVS